MPTHVSANTTWGIVRLSDTSFELATALSPETFIAAVEADAGKTCLEVFQVDEFEEMLAALQAASA